MVNTRAQSHTDKNKNVHVHYTDEDCVICSAESLGWVEPSEAQRLVNALECVRLLTKVVEDVLPQIGKIVLQDYAALNEGLILSKKVLRYDAKPTTKP